MATIWHPVSAVLLHEPASFAGALTLRLLLRAGELRLIHVGDTMLPNVGSGDEFLAASCNGELQAGSAIVFVDGEGYPSLGRVTKERDDGFVGIVFDSVGGPESSIPRSCVLASTSLPRLLPAARFRRALRRFKVELKELWRSPDISSEDPAGSVRDKYSEQAPYYARVVRSALPDSLRLRLENRIRKPGRVLVVGCGVGRECFELAELGWLVTGIDFSRPMIEAARARQASIGEAHAQEVEFLVADVRGWLPHHEYDGVLFTHDVYSFLPYRQDRIDVLRRLRRSLTPTGTVFLSARLAATAYTRVLLTMRRSFRRDRDWGAIHTRWIDAEGRLRRSFVQLFTKRHIQNELSAANLAAGTWAEGYLEARSSVQGR